jgi:Polysaccharide lyase
MGLLGCFLIASDTSSDPNPLPFWGSIECEEASRYSYLESGGDPHFTATGAEQPDDAYRRLTVLDGDEFSGERCELGLNDHNLGPTAFYHEGQHRLTYFSERLPANFPLSAQTWQTVMQMKQAQPADGGGGIPILFMGTYGNRWHVDSADASASLFTFSARTGVWTRFAWDVYYSQDPSQGWIQVSADLNGDGDFNDPGERSPVIHTATLKTEIEGPLGTSDGLAPGDPIPSHLRVGIYHNPSISCPAPTGCSTEVDNVQVLGP